MCKSCCVIVSIVIIPECYIVQLSCTSKCRMSRVGGHVPPVATRLIGLLELPGTVSRNRIMDGKTRRIVSLEVQTMKFSRMRLQYISDRNESLGTRLALACPLSRVTQRKCNLTIGKFFLRRCKSRGLASES